MAGILFKTMSHATAESSNIAEPMDDNQALREILGEVRLNADILSQSYDGIDKQAGTVSSGSPVVRAPKSTIIKTVITNLGGAIVMVSENNIVVKMLEAFGTWVSPLSGKGEIVVSSTGIPCEVNIASYTRG